MRRAAREQPRKVAGPGWWWRAFRSGTLGAEAEGHNMPGPRLTTTDVAQRLKHLEEVEYVGSSEKELQVNCLAIYEREKAEGTELPAILGLLSDYCYQQSVRLYAEQQERRQRLRDDERLAQEQRLLSGADCKWTQVQKSPHWFCRINGRTYRLSPTKDKKWQLYRVNTTAEDEKGAMLGKYQGRGDATKALAEMAYQPEQHVGASIYQM